MTERLSHELASLLAEEDGGSDRVEARDLLRARLARTIAEGLTQQRSREHGRDGETGTIDQARIAAYLDRSVPPAERDAIGAKLANDPVLRSEVASAVLLLDGLKAQPEATPAGLVTRAAAILAPRGPLGQQASATWRAPIAIWSRRPAVWSGLAAILLVAALTPAVVSTIRERNEAPSLRDVKGVPVHRGVFPSPEGKAKGQDSPLCDDSGEPAKKLGRRPGEAETSVDRPASDDDPCRPKPAVKDDQKPKRP
jgi:hypothetical protein